MGCRIVACMTPLKWLECYSSIVNIWPSWFLFHLFYLFYSEVFNRLILLIGGRAHFVSKCKKSKAIVIHHWMVWSSFSVESIQAIMVTLLFLVMLFEVISPCFAWVSSSLAWTVSMAASGVSETSGQQSCHCYAYAMWIDSWWTCLGDVWCCLCKQ